MKIENAKITTTHLGIEDHGIFTAYIGIDGDGWGTSFGGFAFDQPLKDANGKFIKRLGSGFGIEFIKQLLKAVGVETWEKLPGTVVRVKIDGGGFGACKSIGHFMKDQWLDVDAVVKEFKTKESQ